MVNANKEMRLVRALPSNRRTSSVISNNAFSESNHARFKSLPIHFLPKGNPIFLQAGFLKNFIRSQNKRMNENKGAFR